MAKFGWLLSLVCATGLAACSVKRVTFEEGPQDAMMDAAPDAPIPARCDLGVCIDYGSGADGDVLMAGDTDLNIENLNASSDRNGPFADGIAFQVAQASGRTIFVAGDTTGALVPGDLILLIHPQGQPDEANVGKYEVLEVEATTGRTSESTITVTRDIVGACTGCGGTKTLVQRIPQLRNATITGGALTASAWDGLSGVQTGRPIATGIVALFVKDTLTLAGPPGTGIDVSGTGFRGGIAGMRGAEDATSFDLLEGGQDGAPGALAAVGGKGGGASGGGRGGTGNFAGGAAGRGGGGGGASADDNGCGVHGSGGGGAAPHPSGRNPSSVAASRLTFGGGAAAGGGGGAGGLVANQSPSFLASGGRANGAGGFVGRAFSRGGSGSNGDAGGGIILVFARSLAGTGSLLANGGLGGSGGGGGGGAGYDGAAGGGGGAGADGAAGGSIYVRYGSSSWTGSASSAGGRGGGGGGGGAGDGGGAGGGGGGGIGGGGGGGGTRSGCGSPVPNASDGGRGGLAGSCGGVTSPMQDSSVGGGGAPSGGGGSAITGNCSSVGANRGGLSASGNGANGDADPDGGIGGAGGDALSTIWSGGGGGGQAGVAGQSGLTSVAPF
jgi:hypothetical protein